MSSTRKLSKSKSNLDVKSTHSKSPSSMQETMTLFNSTYSGGFSTYLSSNTLQNSSRYWSFPKGDRFFQPSPDNNAKYLAFSTALSPRYSTFGFGERLIQKNLPAAYTPAPGNYHLPSIFDSPKSLQSKGKTFGIARGFYDNVYTPHQDNITPRIAAQVPGPDRYSPLETNPLGKSAKKFSLTSRVTPPQPTTKDYPAPGAYKPVHVLTEPSRYKGVSFGIGNRGSPTGPVSLTVTPGPGTYKLTSPFDKYARISLIGKIHLMKSIKIKSGEAKRNQ
eukprot:TRINITY_DN808_c0_g1_i1.p1 TRINITY_DN808_c0_g1~~TRINITY_DN808_c0_g1_i1.p1  ORF type:complete len:277 (-),score=12.33 TRINITY_DN808_c0_g1_i1:34-864(-)